MHRSAPTKAHVLRCNGLLSSFALVAHVPYCGTDRSVKPCWLAVRMDSSCSVVLSYTYDLCERDTTWGNKHVQSKATAADTEFSVFCDATAKQGAAANVRRRLLLLAL